MSTTHKDTLNKSSSPITGQLFVDSLEMLGYFKYADDDQLPELKKKMRDSYEHGRFITTVNSAERPYAPFCRRYYGCDGETLFEIDGITGYLAEVKPTFDKLGIPLTWSDDYFSDDATEHTIVVNNKKYIAFKGNPNDLLIWGWATKYFVEMLNDQLAMHHSDERVYPISGGNDGRLIFLTKPQYDFIFHNVDDDEERPLEVDLWWKVNTAGTKS